MRRLLVARSCLLWLSVLVLLLLLLRWPAAWSAIRAWLLTIGIVWGFFLLVRSRTISWALVAGVLVVALLWAPVVALVSLGLAAGTGLDTRADGPSIAIAALVEESLKLLPLLVLAGVAPGWFRRRSAGDVLVLGYTLGAGFNAFEDAARRFSSDVANRSLLGDVLRGLLGADDLRYGLNPLAPNAYTDPAGNAGSPGHMVWTALVAGTIALAWALWRSVPDGENRAVPPRRTIAVLVGLVGFSWPVVEHAAFNATAAHGLAWLGAWQIPWPAQVGWLVTGRGLLTGAWLGVLLLAVLLVDAHRRHGVIRGVARSDVIVPGMWSPTAVAQRYEPLLARAFAAPTSSDVPKPLRTIAVGLHRFTVSAVRAGVQAWHDIAVVVSARAAVAEHSSASSSSTDAPLAGRRVALRCGRAAVDLVRRHKSEAMAARTPGGEPGARTRMRIVALSAAAALAVFCLLMAWLGAVAIGADITESGTVIGAGTPTPGAWLAGLFDDLDGWWSGLSLGEQLLVGAGIAALVALSGGSLGLAFGISGVATYGLGKAGGLADLTRDPKAATRDYLTTATWQDLAVDLVEFGLTFAPGNFAGAATGRAVRAGVTEYATDPAAWRARRAAMLSNDTGAVNFSRWGRVNESMSPRARAYQEQITGRSADEAFAVGGVKFDGVLPDGTLIEVKGPGYSGLMKDGEWRRGFHVGGSLRLQAEHQVRAAAGRPVVWHVAELDVATLLRRTFANAIELSSITVIYTPPGATP